MLRWLDSKRPEFPDPATALANPNGLLAVGGNLDVDTLRCAYKRGIFPWFEQGQPILWWSPDPRAVFFPDSLHISRSLKKQFRRQQWQFTTDVAFADVIRACAESRKNAVGTWITDSMQLAYQRLHNAGDAHSIECWQDGRLVGGLYGVACGSVFSGESMFCRQSNASKAALACLAGALFKRGFTLIDCQVASAHINSLGAQFMPRKKFLAHLAVAIRHSPDWPDNAALAMISESFQTTTGFD